MGFLAKNWKKLLYLLGGALSIAGGAAYVGDCGGVGDALNKGATVLQEAGEKPVKPAEPAGE